MIPKIQSLPQDLSDTTKFKVILIVKVKHGDEKDFVQSMLKKHGTINFDGIEYKK